MSQQRNPYTFQFAKLSPFIGNKKRTMALAVKQFSEWSMQKQQTELYNLLLPLKDDLPPEFLEELNQKVDELTYDHCLANKMYLLYRLIITGKFDISLCMMERKKRDIKIVLKTIISLLIISSPFCSLFHRGLFTLEHLFTSKLYACIYHQKFFLHSHQVDAVVLIFSGENIKLLEKISFDNIKLECPFFSLIDCKPLLLAIKANLISESDLYNKLKSFLAINSKDNIDDFLNDLFPDKLLLESLIETANNLTKDDPLFEGIFHDDPQTLKKYIENKLENKKFGNPVFLGSNKLCTLL